ncbi:hypothetical protein [Microbispora sp. GKU 823]|nr:hypothetical protein [Microbispora sp. GKU 823]
MMDAEVCWPLERADERGEMPWKRGLVEGLLDVGPAFVSGEA